jgi:phosphoribosylformylglycinamidine synthase subunit PurSL
MAYVHRIEVRYKVDPRLKVRTDRIHSLGFLIKALHIVDIYTLSTNYRDFTPEELREVGLQLSNPVIQKFTVDEATQEYFDSAIEVGFLPGVTDNVGTTARQTIEDFTKRKFEPGEAVYSSQLYFVCGRLTHEELQNLAETLANPLINRVHIKTRKEYGTTGMDIVVPFVKLHEIPTAELVDLNLDDQDLIKIGKEGILDSQTGQRQSGTTLQQLGETLQMLRSRHLPRHGVSIASTQSLHLLSMMICQRVSTRPVYRRLPIRSGRIKVRRTSA